MDGLKLNNNPLNRLCEQLLRKEKVNPDPYSLYSLQLVKWGLENLDLLGPWAQQQEGLLEQANMMFGQDWRPEEVQHILQSQLDPNSLEKSGTNPQQLATFLIENLHEGILIRHCIF
jgi:hypothetical protein